MGRVRFLLFYLLCGLAAALRPDRHRPRVARRPWWAPRAPSPACSAPISFSTRGCACTSSSVSSCMSLPAYLVLLMWIGMQLLSGLPQLTSMRTGTLERRRLLGAHRRLLRRRGARQALRQSPAGRGPHLHPPPRSSHPLVRRGEPPTSQLFRPRPRPVPGQRPGPRRRAALPRAGGHPHLVVAARPDGGRPAAHPGGQRGTAPRRAPRRPARPERAQDPPDLGARWTALSASRPSCARPRQATLRVELVQDGKTLACRRVAVQARGYAADASARQPRRLARHGRVEPRHRELLLGLHRAPVRCSAGREPRLPLAGAGDSRPGPQFSVGPPRAARGRCQESRDPARGAGLRRLALLPARLLRLEGRAALRPARLRSRQDRPAAQVRPHPATTRCPTRRIRGSGALERFRGFLRVLANRVHSGSARTALDDEETDFYPVALTRRALRPGTIYADPYGHVLMVVSWAPQTADARRPALRGRRPARQFGRPQALLGGDLPLRAATSAAPAPASRRSAPSCAGRTGAWRLCPTAPSSAILASRPSPPSRASSTAMASTPGWPSSSTRRASTHARPTRKP